MAELNKQRERRKRLNAEVPLWRIFSWIGVRVAMSLYLLLWGAGVASAMQVRSQPLVVGTSGSFLLPSALGVLADSNGLVEIAVLTLFVNALLIPMAGIVFLRMSSAKLLDKSHHASVTWSVLTGGYRLQLAPRQVERFAEYLLDSLSTNQADARSFELVRLMAVAMPVRVSRELEARCCGMARWLPSHGFALVQMLAQSAMLAGLWLFEDVVTRIGIFCMALLFLMGFLFALQPHTLGELDRLDMGTKGLCLLHLLVVAVAGQNFFVSLLLVGLHGVTILYIAYAIARGSCRCARVSGASVVQGIHACLPALKRGASHDIDGSRLPSFWDLLRAGILACNCGCVNRNARLRKFLAAGLPNGRGIRIERPQPSRSGTAQWPYIVGVAIAMVQSRKMSAADAAAIEFELLKDARAVFALRHNIIDSATELFEALCPRCVRGSDSVYLPLEYAIEFSANTIRAKPTFHATMDRRLGERLRATRDEVQRSARELDSDVSGVTSSSGSFNSIRKSLSAFTSSARSGMRPQGQAGDGKRTQSFAQRMSFGGSNDGMRSTSDMADFAAGVAHVTSTSLGERLEGVGGGRGSGNNNSRKSRRNGKMRRSAMGSVGGVGGGSNEHVVAVSGAGGAAGSFRVEAQPVPETGSSGPRRQMRRHNSPELGPSRRMPVAKLHDDSMSPEAAGLAERIADLKEFARGLQAVSPDELHEMLAAALVPDSPLPLDTRGRRSATGAAVSTVLGSQAHGHGISRLQLPEAENGGPSKQAPGPPPRKDVEGGGSSRQELPPQLASPSLGPQKAFLFEEVGGADGDEEGGSKGVPIEFGAGGSTLLGDAGGGRSFKARRKSMLQGNRFAPQRAGKAGGAGGAVQASGDDKKAKKGPPRLDRSRVSSGGSDTGIELKSLDTVTQDIQGQGVSGGSSAQRGLAAARAEGHFGRSLQVETGGGSKSSEGGLSPQRSTLRSSPTASAASGALSFAAAGSSADLVRKGRRRRSSLMAGLSGGVKAALVKEEGAKGEAVKRTNPLQQATQATNGAAAASTSAKGGQGASQAAARSGSSATRSGVQKATNPLVAAKATTAAAAVAGASAGKSKKKPPPAPLKTGEGAGQPAPAPPRSPVRSSSPQRKSAMSTLAAIEQLQGESADPAQLSRALQALRDTAKQAEASLGPGGSSAKASAEEKRAMMARMREALAKVDTGGSGAAK